MQVAEGEQHRQPGDRFVELGQQLEAGGQEVEQVAELADDDQRPDGVQDDLQLLEVHLAEPAGAEQQQEQAHQCCRAAVGDRVEGAEAAAAAFEQRRQDHCDQADAGTGGVSQALGPVVGGRGGDHCSGEEGIII